MRNPFKTIIDQYFHFLKKDRNAILVLIVLILIVISAQIIIDYIEPKSKYNYAEYAKLFDVWEAEQSNVEVGTRSLFPFNPNTIDSMSLDSLLIPVQIKRNLLNYRKVGGKFKDASQLKKIYGMNDSVFAAIENFIVIPETTFERTAIEPQTAKVRTGYFDPNDADMETLLDFGFNRFQSRNLINYREKGGVFYARDDLLKIYGIDSSFLSTINKHIQINPVKRNEIVAEVPVLLVELNSAGTNELISLNGIGSVFAERIMKYRELLGGFHSKHQLLEVYNFPLETFINIEEKILVDSVQLRKIRINFAEYAELLRHPYLNKKQVEAILAHRSRHGAFQNPEELKLLAPIDSVSFVKIRPYITCR